MIFSFFASVFVAFRFVAAVEVVVAAIGTDVVVTVFAAERGAVFFSSCVKFIFLFLCYSSVFVPTIFQGF